jgi:1,2-diacylglycerol 3-alpha-glucosyltransferase
MPRIVIHWPHFGPYHLARLKGAGAAMAAHDVEVIGLETAGHDNEYAWDNVSGGEGFRRVVLFPNDLFADLTRRQVGLAVDEALSELRPDAVFLSGWVGIDSVAGLIWSRRNRVPAIAMSESNEFDTPRVWWREMVKAWRVRKYAAAFVGGTHAAQYAHKLGTPMNRVFTGYNAVDNAYFEQGAAQARKTAAPLRVQLGVPRPYFLTSGRFIARKNFDTVIRAFAQYRERAGSDSWDLVVCGSGEEGAELQELTVKLGLNEAVHFPGFVQYPELPQWYGLAGAFIMASYSEPWGLVVNEAMASGLPVIVSVRLGCAPDLVKHGSNGYQFEPRDVDQLAEHLRCVAEVDALTPAMGQASTEIVAKFSPEQFGAGILRTFDAVTGR